MLDAAEHALQLEAFRRDQVLELRLRRPPVSEGVTIANFFDSVAAASPTPGGGSVAAFAAALASCLPAMVAGLTIGKKKYAAAEEEMKRIKTESERLRRELLGFARADGEAFEAVLDAVRMPQTTPAEIEARAQAMAAAGVGACRVPLQTAAACIEVIELAMQAAKSGNRNAVTDAGVGGLLAQAAAEGALLNVEINLKSLQEGADKQGVEMDLHRLAATLRRTSEDCRSAVRSTIDAS